MIPFITIEEPQYKNLPTQEETKRFEAYMRTHVTASNRLGTHFDGSRYFLKDDPDDLALAFEKALSQWCSKHRGNIYSYSTKEVVTNAKGKVIDEYYVDVELISEVCERLEKDVIYTLNKVIREHLDRTDGKIGHFPYSGERVLMTLQDEFGDIGQVKLNPMRLNWTGINFYVLEEVADFNTPGKSNTVYYPTSTRAKKRPSGRKKTKKDPIRSRKTTIGVSAAIFAITFLVTMIAKSLFGIESFGVLMLISDVLFISAAVAVVNLFLLIKALRDQNNPDTFDYFNPNPHAGRYFMSHSVKTSLVGPEQYETYDKQRFERDVKEEYKYLEFKQLWTDACGGEDYREVKKAFFDRYSPFIINKNDIL